MPELADALATAVQLILQGDRELFDIVLLSLQVSLTAVVLAAVVGLPLGAAVAIFRFPGRGVVATLLSATMGMPPVVVGLFLYLLLSRSGPLGVLELLFTPSAMVLAQWCLVMPIIAALTRQSVEDMWEEYGEQLRSLGAGRARALPTLLWDGRRSLVTNLLAGFGRASAEVGAVMIVGGNVDHLTRVMTTAIALETSKGDLVLALALGIILMALSIAVHALALTLRHRVAGQSR
jgi:tungstate transport system permease protein